MNSHDWERFGEDIRRTIQDAVEYGNYDRLNQTITNTMNQATDWVNRNVKNMRTPNMDPFVGQRQEQKSVKRQAAELFETKTGARVTGVLLTVFGYGIGTAFLVGALFLLFGAALLEEFGVGFWMIMSPTLLMLGGCILMAVKGTTMLTSIHRFKAYVKEIGAAEFCNITELAAKVGKSTKFVVKDVEKMIKKCWFRQGHLDNQKTCLIVTDQMYAQYQQLERRKELQRKEDEQRLHAQKKAEQSQNMQRKNLSPEVQKVIEQGDAYVQKIRECNDAIPGEEISAKISRIEMLVDKIFDRVEQSPESVSEIRKLMEYYLPTTVKLLEAYAEMDAQPVGGENIQTAKREIEATLDTLNVAFEKLLDSLFQEAAWDVSSDISVLNTMLAQEGLKEDGLRK